VEWGYWIAVVVRALLAILAGANGHALTDAEGMGSIVEWLGFVAVPAAGAVGADVFAARSQQGKQAVDRAMVTLSQLLRELSAAGRLKSVNNSDGKLQIEYKPEVK
jgi:hypothetical protein